MRLPYHARFESTGAVGDFASREMCDDDDDLFVVSIQWMAPGGQVPNEVIPRLRAALLSMRKNPPELLGRVSGV